jgi:predicted ATPase
MFNGNISGSGMELRSMLRIYQENFTKATDINKAKYKHNESNYNSVSQTIAVITQCTKSYNSKIQPKLTFLVGATGAGKSTLLNYLATDDTNFFIFNEDGAIKTKNKTVAEIGGVSATTLYPNLYECDLGVFLDCAG